MNNLPKAKGGKQREDDKNSQPLVNNFLDSGDGFVSWQWNYIRCTC